MHTTSMQMYENREEYICILRTAARRVEQNDYRLLFEPVLSPEERLVLDLGINADSARLNGTRKNYQPGTVKHGIYYLSEYLDEQLNTARQQIPEMAREFFIKTNQSAGFLRKLSESVEVQAFGITESNQTGWLAFEIEKKLSNEVMRLSKLIKQAEHDVRTKQKQYLKTYLALSLIEKRVSRPVNNPLGREKLDMRRQWYREAVNRKQQLVSELDPARILGTILRKLKIKRIRKLRFRKKSFTSVKLHAFINQILLNPVARQVRQIEKLRCALVDADRARDELLERMITLDCTETLKLLAAADPLQPVRKTFLRQLARIRELVPDNPVFVPGAKLVNKQTVWQFISPVLDYDPLLRAHIIRDDQKIILFPGPYHNCRIIDRRFFNRWLNAIDPRRFNEHYHDRYFAGGMYQEKSGLLALTTGMRVDDFGRYGNGPATGFELLRILGEYRFALMQRYESALVEKYILRIDKQEKKKFMKNCLRADVTVTDIVRFMFSFDFFGYFNERLSDNFKNMHLLSSQARLYFNKEVGI